MDIITSKDNPTIKLYQKLSSSKKERVRNKMFVLEGFRIIKDAIKEKSHITSLIFTQQAFEKYKSEFSQADLNNARIIVISNELGNKISQTEQTQGIFAICLIPKNKYFSLETNGKYVVLVNLQDPGNLGMIIRTADALGIDGLILSGCCDLYSPKTIRSTMGSIFRVKIWEEPDENIIFSELSLHKIKTFAGVIDSDALNINTVDFTGGCAVFIGNEGNGLPFEVTGRCDKKIIIPMKGNINSLNAGMASGILMWELKRND
ncbi:MAG: RNA methyltransferase [Oscillospiraceae bacterium]|nr:RNA methyltransferase [Oscillospiraceae bacterium]